MISTLAWYFYCSIVAILKLALFIIGGLAAFLIFVRIRYNIRSKTQFPYTDRDFAFEQDKYRDILAYDANSLIIRGKRIFLVSGEFHYWRVPDRSRWESILKTYKSCGFNCIRIYFHWGYHSPKEGVYHFDGNRDVDYLLQLCSKLKIFVLAAPGPYICAETQGGGFPLWLIAKRDVGLRHMSWLFKLWDYKFAEYSKQWVDQIMPILKKHQITEKEDGCVLAVQLENELFEFWSWLPIGFVDEMKSLAKFTRDLGITVPLFTNDPWEEGGFVSRPENNKEDNFWTKWISPRGFGLDWYGFDKYATFPPSATPDPIGPFKELEIENWGEWDPNSFASQIDHIEDKVRSFGGEAAKTPILIPELQGGWFSHNCLKTTYDHNYTFFGEHFTKTIFDSVVAQGSTMVSLYMVYGGTNWGTLGDPDVYSSYDYGACIREYGHISGRMRRLRQSLLMYRSFEKYFVRTQRDDLPFITASESNIISSQRCYEAYLDRIGEAGYKANQDVELTLIRNFNENESPFFDIQLFMNSDLQTLEGRTPLILQCYLPYKHSFIALGNYTAANKAHLLFSAVPILLRHRFASDGKNHEVWIIPASDDLYTSELAFEGHYDIGGNIHVQTRIEDEDRVTVFSIGEGEGWVSLRPLNASKNSNSGNLFIIALNQSNLLTLNATFKDDYHWTKSSLNNDEDYDNVEIATWGSYDTYLDKSTGQLDVKFMKQSGFGSSKLYLLKTDSAPIADSRFKQSSLFEGLPFIFELPLDYPNDLVPNKLECSTFDWKVRYTQWDQAPWTSIAKTGSKFELNAIDMRYTTGHCAYMSTFEITDPQPSSAVYLKLDLRHRGTIWINGHYVGSMTVFSRQIFMAGCHCGPELLPGRYKSFDVTRFLKYPVGSGSELNKVVILTESFGINRQSMMFDDARNPRGLLHATWTNLDFKTPPKWYATGIDSQDNHNSYQSSGLFDESVIHSSSDWSPSEALTSMSQINHSTITWYSCKFRHPLSEESLSSPTELNYPLQVYLKGPFVGYIWINKVLIGRYYGNNIGPQKHFYIMEGLLNEDEDNELILAIYPGSLTDLDPKAKSTIDIMNAPIQVEIGPWYVELNDVNQSGNLLPKLEGGMPFVYANTSLQIMNH